MGRSPGPRRTPRRPGSFLRIDAPGSRPLEDILFERGVEFPCGGSMLCGGCRVRVVSGDIPVTPEMAEALTPEELRDGWRLACRAHPVGPVTLDVDQWHTPVLSDDRPLPFEPSEGLGIAIDVGTTTLAGQLLDLATGEVLDVRTGLNPQCRHGADLMSRVGFELCNPGILTRAIRKSLGAMVEELAAGRSVREILLAGNTVMHHLFCGLDVEALAHVPFHTAHPEARTFAASDLAWSRCGAPRVTFLPCLASFVGSDILAGIIATGLHTAAGVEAHIDLGTNGEIVLGNRDGLLCASTAAGPAFEAGRIRMGMRAAPGAIHRVVVDAGRPRCQVFGGQPPRGICGSGLVDAAAAGLELGRILPAGRFANGVREWILDPPVALAQGDIRELQLAKGAIAASLRLLARRLKVPLNGICRIHLAGAFGNYVDVHSARRIGLLPSIAAPVHPAGNAALRGLKLLLLSPSRRERTITRARALVTHVALAAEPGFQDAFADALFLKPV